MSQYIVTKRPMGMGGGIMSESEYYAMGPQAESYADYLKAQQALARSVATKSPKAVAAAGTPWWSSLIGGGVDIAKAAVTPAQKTTINAGMGLPGWVLPVAIAGGALVLVMSLRGRSDSGGGRRGRR